ncbi:MAG: L-aspartate oxidase [bacterium]
MEIKYTRFLSPLDGEKLPSEKCEVLIVGTGVAGLSAALRASEQKKVTLLTKAEIKSSNTRKAQGGVAAVLQEEDSFGEHLKDTLAAGDGLCEEKAVDRLVKEGPPLVKKLTRWSDEFDRTDGQLDFSREGGHSRQRVVHARGDATGAAIEDILVEKVTARENIEIRENIVLVDILTSEKKGRGAVVLERGQKKIIWTGSIVLATGGGGELYRETTNHEVVTGDGMAAAYRAGLTLRDLEFVQFHPTVLYRAGAPRFLITEALRGEGGKLVDQQGKGFMDAIHPMGELAPRDIVSRGILRRMIQTDSSYVYLDVSHLDNSLLNQGYPTIKEVCSRYGIDITREPIPVRPCAHYFMGGIKADIGGRTEFENIFCAGEVASTGVHGANRLASNSLLEGLVMGNLVGEEISKNKYEIKKTSVQKHNFNRQAELNFKDLRQSLQSLLWRQVGILRSGGRLQKAADQLEEWLGLIQFYPASSRKEVELINMMQLAGLLIGSARRRRESRGAHYREDYPEKKSDWKKHTCVINKNGYPEFFYRPVE